MEQNEGDPDFLDVYMEGDAAGWLAVGFSDTPNMVRILLSTHVHVLNCLIAYQCTLPKVDKNINIRFTMFKYFKIYYCY